MVYLPAEEMWALSRMKQGILFLDEVTTAPPVMQKVALRLVHERIAGNLHLGDGIRIVAAGNPPESAADGYDLAAPLSNRMVFLDWEVCMSQWGEYMMSGDPNTLPIVPKLPKTWKKDLTKWRSLVYGFLSRRSALVEVCPKESTQMGLPWPSLRSWDLASKSLCAVDAVGIGEEAMLNVVKGSVGEGAGFEFWSWYKNSDLPDPMVLLNHPEKYEVSKDDSITYAILLSVCSLLASQPSLKWWNALWVILEKMMDGQQKDIAATAMGMIIKIKSQNPTFKYPSHIVKMKDLLPFFTKDD